MLHSNRGLSSRRVAEHRRAAATLRRDLEGELVGLQFGLTTAREIKLLFDRVYAPAGASLGKSLACLRIPEVAMLAMPLCTELAETQIRIELQVLSGISKVLDAMQARR